MSDYFEQVERELASVVRNREHLPWRLRARSRPSPDPLSHTDRSTGAAIVARDQGSPGRRSASEWSRNAARVFPVGLAVLVTILVAAVALTTLDHHSHHRSQPSATGAAVPDRQQLIGMLAVLRRPQTKSDLDPQLLAMLKRLDQRGLGSDLEGAPDLSLIRLATITPWGAKVFLVPLRPLTASELRAAARRLPLAFRRRPGGLLQSAREETLSVVTIDRGGPNYGGGGGITAAEIEAGHGSSGTEGSTPLHGNGGYTRMTIVVPDGVARVTLVLPRQGSQIGPGTPVYKHPLTVTAQVHGNVAAFQIDRQCCTGHIATTWYGANGQVLKQLGNAAATKHIVHTPKPGPETPLSRAAERNPSTANSVWVTPQTGGPTTRFKVHFRVLLTDAFYRYKFTGPRCPQLRTGGSGGIGGGFDDIRGQIWSDPLFAVPGDRLCPGTYHVSVTISSLGIGRPLKQPDRPFGTATFTVRP
jgi:hypothetical protein